MRTEESHRERIFEHMWLVIEQLVRRAAERDTQCRPRRPCRVHGR
jgi:hypothetical protein